MDYSDVKRMRSYEIIEGHMVLGVGHHSADNNLLRPNPHILVLNMVRNTHQFLASNMDGCIRRGGDERQFLLGNVTGPHTFLNYK